MIEELKEFIKIYDKEKNKVWKYNLTKLIETVSKATNLIDNNEMIDGQQKVKFANKVSNITEKITGMERILFFEEVAKDLETKIPVTVEDNLLKDTKQWVEQIKKKYYNDEETNNSITQIEVALNSRNLDEIFRGITFFLKDRHLRKGETPELEENPEVYEGYVIADMIALRRGYNNDNEITRKRLVEGLKERSKEAFYEAERRLMIYQTKEEVTKNEFKKYLNGQAHWNEVYEFF